MQLKCKPFVQCVEKVLRLIERVKIGWGCYLVQLTFWPNNSLLCGCLRNWKMFSSTPASTHKKQIAGHSRHTENIQINKVIGENENVSFILENKLNEIFGQSNI